MNFFPKVRSSGRLSLLTLLAIISLFSCNFSTEENSASAAQVQHEQKIFRLESPTIDQSVSLGDSIQFRIKGTGKKAIDSVEILTDGQVRYVERNTPFDFRYTGLFEKVGRQHVRLKLYSKGEVTQTLSVRVVILSASQPEKLAYSLVQKYTHNTRDYTQGLFYYNKLLYEGTGHERQSRLIKYAPHDSENILLERKLDDKFFGEGITRVGDKIYQLTYQHKVGFVYMLEDFSQVREFDLQTMEGWGLAYDGKDLIISDGSSALYFFDPEYLRQPRQMDVANHSRLVNNLNELEYVEGVIWANIYTTNTIVKIDAESGKVLGELDLSALFPSNTPHDYYHVLNGIAYNPDKNTFFVTGKYWPVIYEIKIY